MCCCVKLSVSCLVVKLVCHGFVVSCTLYFVVLHHVTSSLASCVIRNHFVLLHHVTCLYSLVLLHHGHLHQLALN